MDMFVIQSLLKSIVPYLTNCSTYNPTIERAIIDTFSPWLTADRWMDGCVRLSLTHCGEYPVRGWVRSSYCGEAYPVVQTLATTPPA